MKAGMIAAIEKYLARHLEPEAQDLGGVRRTFGHVLVIPAFDEGESLFRTLNSIPAGPLGDVLTVLVVNAPENAPSSTHFRSQELIRQLNEKYEHGSPVDRGQPHWLEHPRGAMLCVGPRSLPKGQGVGLARKIGCDIALRLHTQGTVHSPWIHTTDADVQLPTDYFERTPLGSDQDGAAALIYPFWHQCEPPAELADAMHRYELFLRYYVLGLADARSPYAFHTLGSTVATHAVAYAKVRGFPRRAAGEDFYLLNKLAKVGTVFQLAGTPLVVGGRASHRVPFGTGAALNQILAAAARGERYRTYAPEVFRYLKIWLATVELLCEDQSRRDPSHYLSAAVQGHEGVDASRLYREMEELGFLAAIRRAKAISPNGSTIARHLHTWFDAFRTLKLIHRLTRLFPKRELIDAIRSAPFLSEEMVQSENLEELRCSLFLVERRLKWA